MLSSNCAVTLVFQQLYTLTKVETLKASQVLQAFGIQKSRTTVYHPQGDGMVERFSHYILQMFRCYVDHEDKWECYYTNHWYCMHIKWHSTLHLQQKYSISVSANVWMPATFLTI